MTDRTTTERHYSDHPMRGLSDEELAALTELSLHARIFGEPLAARLSDLGDLAIHEEGDRIMRADLAESRPKP